MTSRLSSHAGQQPMLPTTRAEADSRPALLWSSKRARRGSLSAPLLTTGLLLWWAYCYAHLAMGAPEHPPLRAAQPDVGA